MLAFGHWEVSPPCPVLLPGFGAWWQTCLAVQLLTCSPVPLACTFQGPPALSAASCSPSDCQLIQPASEEAAADAVVGVAAGEV